MNLEQLHDWIINFGSVIYIIFSVIGDWINSHPQWIQLIFIIGILITYGNLCDRVKDIHKQVKQLNDGIKELNDRLK
jgi:hypothetical protein